MIKRRFLAVGMLWLLFTYVNAEDKKMESVILKNDFYQVTIEPRWGGRASSIISLDNHRELIGGWGEVKKRRNFETRSGGGLRGMISGSYVSEQMDEPYTVRKKSPVEVVLVYSDTHPPMDGLREEKTVKLSDNEIICSIKITNTSLENRTFYYRLQDWLRPVESSQEAIHIVPQEKSPIAFKVGWDRGLERHFVDPLESWFAIVDSQTHAGLRVVSKHAVKGIYFWVSEENPQRRTAEFFFPRCDLAPGESWETTLTYSPFSTDQVEDYLKNESSKIKTTGLPYHAKMKTPPENRAVVVTPIHSETSIVLNGFKPLESDQTLESLSLSGTPGEVLSFAFAVTARSEISEGVFSLKSLQSDGLNHAFDVRYVAGDSLLLVHDWKLAQNIPLESVSHINNTVVDPDETTPFSLAPDATAWIWVQLRIPEDAPAGKHQAQGVIQNHRKEIASFEISVNVRSFKLKKAPHKNYGVFFRYYLKPSQGKESKTLAPYYITREEYLDAIKRFADVGVQSFAIYLSNRQDILWLLDEAKKLGMHGEFILIYPHSIKPEDLKERGMTAYGWTVDEPSLYEQIPHLLTRYEEVQSKGFKPVFTPNLPLGIVMSDRLDKMVPVFNVNGNAPYLKEITETTHMSGRPVYWYECDGLGVPSIKARVLRGVYLWKEPVDGIYDWDHGSASPKWTIHHLVGYAGTKLLPRLGLENIRQGLIDLNYLYTLESLAKESKDPDLKNKAVRLMEDIRQEFDTNYHRVIPYIQDPQYLDDVRNRVGDLIEELNKTQGSYPQ